MEKERPIASEQLFGPLPDWCQTRWFAVLNLGIYAGMALGLAAIFNGGPLAVFVQFFPVEIQLAGILLLPLGCMYRAVFIPALSIFTACFKSEVTATVAALSVFASLVASTVVLVIF